MVRMVGDWRIVERDASPSQEKIFEMVPGSMSLF